VVNACHFDCKVGAPREVKLIFDHSRAFFVVIFSRHISNLNFRKDTFSNANSYFTFTSLNCSHSLQNGLTWKAVKYDWNIHGAGHLKYAEPFEMYCYVYLVLM
jgi:hypothetical protein